MPQICIFVGPGAGDILSPELLDFLADLFVKAIEREFGILGEDDVAVDVFVPHFTKGEADVQVEVRYTAGEKEYGREEPFDPTTEEKERACGRIDEYFRLFLARRQYTGREDLSLSVWLQPYHKSVFREYPSTES